MKTSQKLLRTSQELLRAWVTRLRANTDEQTTGRLRKDDAMCCLGVACDIVDPTKWKVYCPWSPDNKYTLYDHDDNYMPQEVAALYSISEKGYLPFSDREDQQLDLAVLNDEAGCTFSQIADVIEYFFIEK